MTNKKLSDRIGALIDTWFASNVNGASRHYGIPQPTLYRLATGLTVNPSADTLMRVAKAHATTIEWLLTGVGPTAMAPKMTRRDQLSLLSRRELIELALKAEKTGSGGASAGSASVFATDTVSAASAAA